MWSPVERTALADAEIEYHDHVSPTIWVKFPVKTYDEDRYSVSDDDRGENVFRLAEEGDVVAVGIVEDALDRLARVCAVLAGPLDLDAVVIGGGFLKHSGYAGAADLIGGIIGGQTIFAFAYAIVLTQGLHVSAVQWAGFIFMLGITMVAAPGVPGGAIMAAVGLLTSMLGFTPEQVALMIAAYIAIDSFGTAANVTGDGAIALIVNRFTKGKLDREEPEELSDDELLAR